VQCRPVGNNGTKSHVTVIVFGLGR
jgi:hypothetical protein